jgi:hypothetical protein
MYAILNSASLHRIMLAASAMQTAALLAVFHTCLLAGHQQIRMITRHQSLLLSAL